MAADRQRIDKWLWFARVVKTRTAAQKLVAGGRVRINGERHQTVSRQVATGDVLTIVLGRGIRILRVKAPGRRRGPADEARTLFDDLTPPEAARPRSGATQPAPAPDQRPDRRDRRAIRAFNRSLGGDFSSREP